MMALLTAKAVIGMTDGLGLEGAPSLYPSGLVLAASSHCSRTLVLPSLHPHRTLHPILHIPCLHPPRTPQSSLHGMCLTGEALDQKNVEYASMFAFTVGVLAIVMGLLRCGVLCAAQPHSIAPA